MKSWHSLSLGKLTLSAQGKYSHLEEREESVGSVWCRVRNMARAASRPWWEQLATSPARGGQAMQRRVLHMDVGHGCGSWCIGRASHVDLSSNTEESSAGDVLQTCFLPYRSKLFNPIHSSPQGGYATQLENRLINKATISVSSSRSNLRLLSEICCFPPPAASWQ